MMMICANTDMWGHRLRRATFFIMVSSLLLAWSPARAEWGQAATGSDMVKTDGETPPSAPGTEPLPDVITAPPTTEKVKPPSAPETALSPARQSYSGGAVPNTAIGAFSSDYSFDESKYIVVPRSGGLPSLSFLNKAENWLSGGISVAQSYDSNVFLSSIKHDDLITRVSPALAFRYQNKLLDWNLGSSLDYRYYLWNTRTEDFSYGLNTKGKIKIYRDYAFIDISDVFTQTSQTNSIDYSSLSSTVNVTDLNTLRVNPRMEIPLASRLRFNPQYSYSNYWYPSQSQQNRQNHSVSADLAYEMTPRLTPAFGYNFVRMDGQLIKYNQNFPFLRITYQDDRFTVSGSIGYSRMDLDSGSTSEGMVWSANISYRLASTTLSFLTSSDVDQSAYMNSNSSLKTPQIVTSYTGSFSQEFRRATFSSSIYFRENKDAQSSLLISRRLGMSGSLSHTITSRLGGSFSYILERSDQRTVIDSRRVSIGPYIVVIPLNPPVDLGGTQSLLYQLGYGLNYYLGDNWVLSGGYTYTNSSSPNTVSYSDNKVSLSAGKSF
jgi:hypothetical protein